ncbi:unnamed protein product [Nesidiocoris tenuis]|uniref:SET domain-containing protein n=1 Tax=Nesidiocoris tenuis TaxID=355587 RepID=A0A6H5HTG9_9HEMI|nr:unnamed protein product [Nesidiocoris tenuis]
MGRTYRHRKKKTGEQRPVPLGNDVGYLGLVNWLADRKWSPSCKLVPVTFSDTGRGMMAKENIPAGTILASLPASALITARTVADSPLAELFLNTSACFSTQQVLSSFLVLQKHLGEDSDWFAYINILPLQYFSPVFATSDLIDAFPPTIVHKILRMQTKIDHLHSSLMGAVGQSRCPHCSKLYSELFTFDEFRWAWFTVNSRSVYLSPSVNKPCDIQLSDPNNIALAPYLDMINHSDLAKVNVLFDEANSTYSIVTLVPYKKHQEVFINYGSHSNEKLYLEYDFARWRSSRPHLGQLRRPVRSVHPVDHPVADEIPSTDERSGKRRGQQSVGFPHQLRDREGEIICFFQHNAGKHSCYIIRCGSRLQQNAVTLRKTGP